jgi:polar amino acid transport system substrate-binding protein
VRALSVAVSLLFFSALAQAAERPLRFSVSDSSTMPMIHLENGQPVDGILHDLHRRIAEKLGRKAEQLVMSRTRIQPLLAEGAVDVSCYMNPAWLAVDHASYRWSVPFMTQRSILVAQPETPPAKLSSLRGRRVGTVLGFFYPEADASFRDGTLIRDDARTEHLVLKKLAAGRERYAISTQVALDWFNRDRPVDRRLKAIDRLSESSIHCIVRVETDVPAREILDVMQQMQHDVEFEAILAKYR